ncbi:MAG: SGNH/GDSL hydrolase family protein [Frankiaceae bacterium]
MSRSRFPLRLRRHALFGGGGFGLLGAAGLGLLYGEVHLARRAIPSFGSAPSADGRYGSERDGHPLRLAMIGDSSAAGVGCELPSETPGAQLAAALVERGHHVELDVLAVSGSRSCDLEPQVSRCLLDPPDIAVVSVGANDVIGFIKPRDAVPHLIDAVRRLQAAGVVVVVATCPDLGVIRPVPQPLRALGRHWSRRMARAQVRATLAEGAMPLDTGDLIGTLFAERAAEMFCHDRFHPSAAGYRELTRVLLHAVLAAVDEPPPAPHEALGEPATPPAGDIAVEMPSRLAADGAGDALTA